jgi:hypothetical protein
MNTDDLIEALARDPAPAETPKHGERATFTVLLGTAAALVLLLLFWGVRPDIVNKMPIVIAKAGFSAFLAAAAAPLLLRLARPGRPVGWRTGLLGLALLGGVIAASVALFATPAAERMAAWTGGGFPWCLLIIPTLAAPIAAGLMWLLRSMAPTQLELTGAAIGGVAGGLGAMVYALYCPVDSAAFVATWYSVAIGLCAVVGALIGGRILRW